jgi:hypothetical protein
MKLSSVKLDSLSLSRENLPGHSFGSYNRLPATLIHLNVSNIYGQQTYLY